MLICPNRLSPPARPSDIWDRINSVAKAIDIEAKNPHITALQIHRRNASAENIRSQSLKDYYRVNVFNGFLNHVVSELYTRIAESEEHTSLIAADAIVPSKLGSLQPKHL